MKILFLAPQPFFQARGTPINVRNVLKVLGESGREVDLLTYHLGEDVELDNVRIRRIPPVPFVKHVAIGFSPAKIPLDISMFLHAGALVVGNGYDLVHAVEESVFMAHLLKKLFKIPYIYDMDSVISDQLLYTGKLGRGGLLNAVERLEREAAREALAVLTVCSSLSGKAAALAPGVKIFQAEDCPLEIDKKPSALTRARLKIKEDDIVVMYTGNLESYQGVGLLLKSFGIAARQFNGIQLVIAGGEPAQIEEYKRKARQMGLEWSVKFAGRVPPEEASSLLEQADILASPRLEGTNTPLKIYDYLLSGKPVVATNLPMHTQVLDKKKAVLAEPEPEAFSNGILKLARSPAMRTRLGRSGRKSAGEKYGFSVFREKILRLYNFAEKSLKGDKN
jgi:glycosyltransferase involved in cell wall biosynthesis